MSETILQIGMRDHGIQMLAEEAALLPHIESTFGQSNTTGSAITADGATNSTENTISAEGSGTNLTSGTELSVINNTLSGLSDTNNETSDDNRTETAAEKTS